jgi:hypothetical protein
LRTGRGGYPSRTTEERVKELIKDLGLISVDDAVKAYGLSRTTLFRLIGDHKLKSFKRRIGDKKTYISKRAIKQLLTPKNGRRRYIHTRPHTPTR